MPRTSRPTVAACVAPRASTLRCRPSTVPATVATTSRASSHGQRWVPRQVAEQPEDHAAQLRLVAEREQQAHQRARAGRHDDAGEQQPRRRPAARPLCQREHQQAGGEGPGGRETVDPDGRQSEHDRHQRRDRRTAGHAEHVRIGQRIAQQDLQQSRRTGQQPADRERRQRPRQPQVEHHVAGQGRGIRAENRQHLRQVQAYAAHGQRQREQARDGHGQCAESDEKGWATVHRIPLAWRSLRCGRGGPQGARPDRALGPRRRNVKK